MNTVVSRDQLISMPTDELIELMKGDGTDTYITGTYPKEEDPSNWEVGKVLAPRVIIDRAGLERLSGEEVLKILTSATSEETVKAA